MKVITSTDVARDALEMSAEITTRYRLQLDLFSKLGGDLHGAISSKTTPPLAANPEHLTPGREGMN